MFHGTILVFPFLLHFFESLLVLPLHITLNKAPVTLYLPCSTNIPMAISFPNSSNHTMIPLYRAKNENATSSRSILKSMIKSLQSKWKAQWKAKWKAWCVWTTWDRHGCRVSQEWGVGVRNVPARCQKKKTKNDSRETERATCSSTLSGDHKDWVSIRALPLVKCSCCSFWVIVFGRSQWYRS